MDAFADWDHDPDGVLGGGTVAYHRPEGQGVPIIYGDYFLVEGLLRLLEQDAFLW